MTAAESARRTIINFSPSRRIVVPVLVLAVLALGTAQGMQSGHEGSPAPAQQESLAIVAPDAFQYFPAQYVNQATQAEAHIQAF